MHTECTLHMQTHNLDSFCGLCVCRDGNQNNLFCGDGETLNGVDWSTSNFSSLRRRLEVENDPLISTTWQHAVTDQNFDDDGDSVNVKEWKTC